MPRRMLFRGFRKVIGYFNGRFQYGHPYNLLWVPILVASGVRIKLVDAISIDSRPVAHRLQRVGGCGCFFAECRIETQYEVIRKSRMNNPDFSQ